MSKKKQKEVKQPVKPSQSGRKRGEKEESKVAQILTTAGVGILLALVVALIVALIVVSLSNRKPAESPFIDEVHVTYANVQSIIVDEQISALNEVEESRDAYRELIKEKSFIVFYRNEDLKNDEFVNAVLDAKSDSVGIVLYNLDLFPDILGEEDNVLSLIEFSDPKLLPFTIVISGSGSQFDFFGRIENVIKQSTN